MDARHKEFILFCETSSAGADGVGSRDEWRFILQSADGSERLEAADTEPDVRGERLELLSVVRGLEALDQPAHVTLVTSSRYVRHGLVYGLSDWRENAWQWDRFGEMTPVKNADLWRRIDRAMEFHTLVCRTWRIDSAAAFGGESTDQTASDATYIRGDGRSASSVPPMKWPAIRHRLRQAISACRERWAMASAQ